MIATPSRLCVPFRWPPLIVCTIQAKAPVRKPNVRAMVDPGSSRSGRIPVPAVSAAATARWVPVTGSRGATAAKARAPDSAWSWPSMRDSRGLMGRAKLRCATDIPREPRRPARSAGASRTCPRRRVADPVQAGGRVGGYVRLWQAAQGDVDQLGQPERSARSEFRSRREGGFGIEVGPAVAEEQGGENLGDQPAAYG